ncbi:MAG: Spx/MgsR family RNA polymerase-binding regulatory protein [Salinisphaera sp.]|uniref:arsenate reductase family protein n=1 Tax=Salinisphaera sp. TaxID=1914330 RepID=UPI003C7D4331
MITLYGIKTCDTCRRARKWLDSSGVDYRWVDVREDGVTRDRLEAWRDALGDAALLNKRSKTWRDFDSDTRAATEADPIPVLLEHPTLIKRPILETDGDTLAGFSDTRYASALGIGGH